MAEGSDHVVRKVVADFALVMERKLCEKDHKGGWDDMDFGVLLIMLREEVQELDDAIETYKDTPDDENLEDIILESADIANFAMMIADTARSRHGRPA